MDTQVTTVNENEAPIVLPLMQDASTQASAPKMKSISVSVHVKGIDKGNVVM